ncbi:MAG: cytochrome P460 family protein [Planctomycetota bacterium]|nr:cytochrome P460 family protein [Planctomycetota bacterium]
MRTLLFALIVAASCLPAEEAVNAPPAPAEAAKDLNDERFHDLLLAVAKAYKDYGRVDDEARWAPTLCRAPFPGTIRESASKDEGTHGRKLYYLYAFDAKSYIKSARGDWFRDSNPNLKLPAYQEKPAAQAIIKEAWVPKEATAEDLAQEVKRKRPFGEPERLLKKGEKTFLPAAQGPLFLMVKLDEKTEGTDAGWVYGTLTPDGKRVTSAGKVQSCMTCHENAGAGRLFGLKPREGVKGVPPEKKSAPEEPQKK